MQGLAREGKREGAAETSAYELDELAVVEFRCFRIKS